MNFLNINSFWNLITLEKYRLLSIEIIGTVFGIIATWLASKEKIANYLFGLISVVSFSIVFFQIHLYASLLLQFFFILANFYGLYTWNKNKKILQIRCLSFKKITIYFLLVIFAISFLFFYINVIFYYFIKYFLIFIKMLNFKVNFSNFTPDIFPFFDSCILILSILAMTLLIKKYIENWIVWIVVNIINIIIFIYQKIYIMAIEYVFLAILSLYGFYSWLYIKNNKSN